MDTCRIDVANLAGQWVGTNRLWLSPKEPARESPTEARVALVAQGQFVTIHYTWADEGAPQDGLLIIGCQRKLNAMKAVWVDSWHYQDRFMLCEGTVGASGLISFKGSYAAPPGPDWGWRIDIEPERRGKFRIVMHNVSPDGKAELAVEASYARQLR